MVGLYMLKLDEPMDMRFVQNFETDADASCYSIENPDKLLEQEGDWEYFVSLPAVKVAVAEELAGIDFE